MVVKMAECRDNVQNYDQISERIMAISAADVISLTLARATLSDLADQVKAGAEKIITKNGESYVALIDAARLDYYHRLERERIHLVVLNDVEKGLSDIASGRTRDAREALDELKHAPQPSFAGTSGRRRSKPHGVDRGEER